MTLAPVFLGSLGRRRMASLFSLLAIILGVALGMAVQAIHEAALYDYGSMNLAPSPHGLTSTITPLAEGLAARGPLATVHSIAELRSWLAENA